MQPSADELNQALGEYVQTTTHEKRLDEYLLARHDEPQRAEIKAALKNLMSATEDYLWAQPGGVAWSPAFEEQLFGHLRAKHDWLGTDGFHRVLSFSKWLCWHEGLNRQP